MRRLLLSTLFIVVGYTGFAQNSPLLTFDELLETFKRGYDVKVTFYYARCDAYSNDKKVSSLVDNVAGMSINAFDYFAKSSGNGKAFITFSNDQLIENPSGPGYVRSYLSAKVYEDGKVSITLRHLNPLTMESKKNERFETVLYDGQNKSAGAYFFVSH
jgi:hypothetical protein